MNLAWNELVKLNGAPLDVNVAEEHLQMLANFNSGTFTSDDLANESYYVKAGFGQPIIATINK